MFNSTSSYLLLTVYPSQRSDRDAPSALGCCSPQIRIIFSYGMAPQPQWHILQLFQGPSHATLELKFQGVPPIDLVTLLSSLWCWQRAAYELAAVLDTPPSHEYTPHSLDWNSKRESWEAPLDCVTFLSQSFLFCRIPRTQQGGMSSFSFLVL